jgi:DNA-binding CsgD family transcriptional regulator
VSGQVRVLTRRQVEVLRVVANGHTNAEAAALLSVSAETVATSLRLVYRALGVGDRAHAVAVALRVGLLRPGEIHVPESLRARLRPAQTTEAPEVHRSP